MSEFKIGDIVCFRASVAESKYGFIPKAFVVTELISQTCPGGTQKHLVVAGEEGVRQVLEIEVIPYDNAEIAENIIKGINLAVEHGYFKGKKV